ncbi:hypothetical protein Aduo_005491 [Ancylostoma duodenale]
MRSDLGRDEFRFCWAMRAKFVARLLVAFLIAAVVAFVLFHCRQLMRGYSVKESDDSTRRPQKEPSQLIQRSVLLRYGDTDPLVIFSAHSHHGNITIILASYGYMMRRLFCRLFDDQKQEILPAAQSVVFPEFTVRCPASESARFAAVSLNADDDVPVVEMHSIEPASSSKQHFFSVCMAPLWGNAPKWLMLIEFVEYYLLQGAEHFFIYKQHVDELTMTVLDKYIREGVVDVVEVNEATNCLKRHRCRHEMQLQDCVFRSRGGRSKWVAVVDLDERISVNGSNTLKQYIRSVGETSFGELRFRCRWVLRYAEIPADPETWRKEGARIPMAIWHNTSHVAPLNHTTKSIIQPEMVEGMGVHQVLRFTSPATVFLVPPEEAVVRHYRNVQGWAFFLKEAEGFGSFEPTVVAPDVIEQLQGRVLQAVDRLFLDKHSTV